MPMRVASWNTDFGLAAILDMNLPEGALRALLARRFAKAAGTFDVTTQAYLAKDPMALTLNGTTNWPDRRKLVLLARPVPISRCHK